MKVGYARVSDVEQNLDTQVEHLSEAGCERVFTEKFTATGTAPRPVLEEVIDFLRDGDTLMVTRLDRFGRSVREVYALLERLKKKGVGFQCLLQPLNTTTPEGKMMMGVLAVFAQFELDLRASRQAEGIARKKQLGLYKRKITHEDVEPYRLAGWSQVKAAKALQVDPHTIRRNSLGPWAMSLER